jgi:hypothetical protein
MFRLHKTDTTTAPLGGGETMDIVGRSFSCDPDNSFITAKYYRRRGCQNDISQGKDDIDGKRIFFETLCYIKQKQC